MTQAPLAEANAVRSRRAVGFVVMSALLPGSVQSFAGNRAIGRWATRIFGSALVLVLLIGLGLLILRGPTLGFLLTPAVALLLRIGLWILFGAWVLLLLDSWRLARPLRLPRRPRLLLTVSVLVMALLAGGVTSVASTALVGAGNVGEVFSGGGDSEVKAGRYNVLLLGADAGAGREGLRPDSINVASIDAESGRAILFGLPRNLQRVRFPESSPLRELYPDGFVCEDGACMLNGVYTLGSEHADLYPGKDAGLEAMKEAVGETLGLELNYYAMVDMAGFSSLIDAMGGIRLDIGKPIPIGGVGSKISGYIEPGENVLLDGYHALWFARSRAESSDYERMLRQKCVMSAMVAQLDPFTVATRFVDLSETGANILSTDVGRGEIATLAELALKTKDLPIAAVNFAPPLIVAAEPDFGLIRETVRQRIEESDALEEQTAKTPSPAPSAVGSVDPGTTSPAPSQTAGTPAPTGGGSASVEPSPTADTDEQPTQTGDLGAVCSVSG